MQRVGCQHKRAQADGAAGIAAFELRVPARHQRRPRHQRHKGRWRRGLGAFAPRSVSSSSCGWVRPRRNQLEEVGFRARKQPRRARRSSAPGICAGPGGPRIEPVGGPPLWFGWLETWLGPAPQPRKAHSNPWPAAVPYSVQLRRYGPEI